MKHLLVTSILTVALIAGTASAVVAHEVTSKGTVASVDSSKPDEKAITVNVVDDKTKATKPSVFYADAETKIFRGEAPVTFAAATFEKGENITVTVNHDLDEQLAIMIRLDPRK